MIKLLLTLLMMFIFGTSTVNAEENTASIEDRISELAEAKPEDSQSAINSKVEDLSKDELKAIIVNVDELTEPTEDDLAIKEAASNKLEEMEREHMTKHDNSFALLLLKIGVALLIFSTLILLGSP